MSNLVIRDGAAATKYLSAMGTGTDGDPLVLLRRAVDESGSLGTSSGLLTVKRAVINAAAVGDTTIVAAVASKKLRVLSLFALVSNTSSLVASEVKFTWKSNATVIFPQTTIPDSGLPVPLAMPCNPHGWMETAAGESLVVNLDVTGLVLAGVLQYVEAT